MLTDETWSRLRRMRWQANRRTLPQRHVSTEVLDEVIDLREQGNFSGAVRLLEEQPADRMRLDNRALVHLALARYGMEDLDGAHDALDRAEHALTVARGKIALNRAALLKNEKRFAEALESAAFARKTIPDWSAAHLMIVGILETRREAGDRQAARDAVAAMKDMWPGWRHDADLFWYLLYDADFAALRTDDDEFAGLFGAPASLFEKMIDKNAEATDGSIN